MKSGENPLKSGSRSDVSDLFRVSLVIDTQISQHTCLMELAAGMPHADLFFLPFMQLDLLLKTAASMGGAALRP